MPSFVVPAKAPSAAKKEKEEEEERDGEKHEGCLDVILIV